MRKLSLEALARDQLDRARTATARRSSRTVWGGHEQTLRQTLVALLAGATLSEHDNPGETTLYVLSGRVTLSTDAATWDARTGDLLIVPRHKHAVRAVQDSVLLLSAVPGART